MNIPAFPTMQSDDLDLPPSPPQTGMTLLDYFAGRALQGLISVDLDNQVPPVMTAHTAYSYAEAMLKERLERL